MKLSRTLATAALVATLAATSLAGCAASGSSTPAAAPVPPSTTPVVTAPTPIATPDGSTVARLHQPTTVYAEPDERSDLVVTLDPTTELGSTTALLVIDERTGWLHVSVPVRPNGTTGWIRDTSVERRHVDARVEVDLHARTLVAIDGDEVVFRSDIAVGADDTPTPTGAFFVTDLVDTGDRGGAYGPYAIGLSAHSDQLTEFAGGDGQVGIHGTNDPSSIGQPVSHGCVRLPNEAVSQLFDLVELGTPVVIR